MKGDRGPITKKKLLIKIENDLLRAVTTYKVYITRANIDSNVEAIFTFLFWNYPCDIYFKKQDIKHIWP